MCQEQEVLLRLYKWLDKCVQYGEVSPLWPKVETSVGNFRKFFHIWCSCLFVRACVNLQLKYVKAPNFPSCCMLELIEWNGVHCNFGLGSVSGALTTTNLGTVLNQYRVRDRGDTRESECATRENVPIYSSKFLSLSLSFLPFFHLLLSCSMGLITSKLEQSGKQSTSFRTLRWYPPFSLLGAPFLDLMYSSRVGLLVLHLNSVYLFYWIWWRRCYENR